MDADRGRAILHGRQPADLNAHKLMADTRAPIDWHEQRRAISLRGAIRVAAGPRTVPLERPKEIFGVSGAHIRDSVVSRYHTADAHRP